jgi:maltooligosyltrehalose trehalohydrolase
MSKKNRRFPIGAEIDSEGIHFRLWAPKAKKATLFLFKEKKHCPMEIEKDGYFSLSLPHMEKEVLYQFYLDGRGPFPDPASRFQPEGPFGPSQVIDNTAFLWTDEDWKGLDNKRQILYELHIGTFTPEGTWFSAMKKLPDLVDLGITTVEMMPIADFPGKFNWGYDGVNLFAPTRNYGTPDELRAFINEAHRYGLGVILDLVCNHLGPSGNYLKEFSEDYFTHDYVTEWGEAINFDGTNARSVREFYLSNIEYWVEEFHFDGFRFDACHAIKDASPHHIISEMSTKARQKAGSKALYISAENESQIVQFVMPTQEGGYGLDGVWNEDFHHTAGVRLTCHREAYYLDYLGKAQEFISSAKYGFLYQGQWYSWQHQRRGTPSFYIKPYKLINFLENHDQVANSANSLRYSCTVHPATLRVMLALLFLLPQTPLLFQGQEFGSLSPFYYFCDHSPELNEKIIQGRFDFLKQFKSVEQSDVKRAIPHPNEESTFLKSKLNWNDKTDAHGMYPLHKDLIDLRKHDPVFSNLDTKIEGSVFNDDAFVLRYFSSKGERLLLINFGVDLELDPAPEPLLAAPSRDEQWKLVWHSEAVKYGGVGCIPFPEKGNWRVTGNAAFIFTPYR